MKEEKTKNWLRGKKYILLLFGLFIFGFICITSFYLTKSGVNLDWLEPVSAIGGTLAIILGILKIIKKLRKTTKKT